jgi:hypothetical protein
MVHYFVRASLPESIGFGHLFASPSSQPLAAAARIRKESRRAKPPEHDYAYRIPEAITKRGISPTYLTPTQRLLQPIFVAPAAARGQRLPGQDRRLRSR